MNQLILAILLSLAPIFELRGGMPVAINYALKNSLPLIPIIALIILANIAVIFIVFYFLDNFHKKFIKLKFYKRFFSAYLSSLQKKVDKLEKSYMASGFIALMIFVAVPLPGTGAWTGAIIAWILGLERKESSIAIALGVVIAGIIIALGTLGVISILN